MFITLRKASALQALVNETITNMPIATAVVIGKFSNPTEALNAAKTKYTNILNNKLLLISVLYSLRKKQTNKSAEAGIPDVLTDIAGLEKIASVIKQLPTRNFSPNEETLLAMHNDLKTESTSNAYNRRESIEVSLLEEAWVVDYANKLVEIRKEKQALSDKLLELNIKNFIELSDDEEKVLVAFGLI